MNAAADDPRAVMRDLLPAGPAVELLADGFRFLEGPVWLPSAGGLVFSDIPADRMYLYRSGIGVSVWREPSRNANGNTLDRQGRLLTCEHGSRRVTRTEPDGSVTILAESYNGKRLNSPNDIACRGDGSIWFTDPPYGIRPEQQEQPACYVFRLDPDGTLTAVADDFVKPNGICFSPDESVLYVSDTFDERHHIRRFRVNADGTLAGGEEFAVIAPGKSDGFRVDTAGRIITSAGDGIHVLSPTGTKLGVIAVPETPANCTFGGPDGDILYITARTGLYSVRLGTRAAH